MVSFETMNSILKDYHDAMNDRNPDLTYVPKMYINKDYWVTKISIPYDIADLSYQNTGLYVDIELDDRPDEHYWGCLQYDEISKTGIDFCVWQPEEVGDTPRLSLYPVVDGNIDTSKELQIECEIINEL